MSSNMLAFAAFLLLALAACQREAPAPSDATADAAPATAAPAPAAEAGTTATPPAPADAAAPADDPLAGTDASAVEDHGNAAGFDSKGFAGIFRGTLPCADCPGIETRLQLEADGSYTLEETYLERGGPYASQGTWTAEQDGTRLRLDPNGKSEADRLFAIVSQDTLRLLDGAGKPIADGLPHELARAAQ